jgi:hypothetical protein
MQRFSRSQLETFLVAVDEALETTATITIIGGSALALAYGVTTYTNDVDTYSSELAAIERAAMRARRETGLDIAISNSTVAQLPSGFEERLQRALPELSCLHVWVVEAHDLAASKLLRGNDHDRQQLAQLHELVGLDRALLVSRFDALMHDYVGDAAEPRWALFHFVEEVWGELAALPLRPT